MERNGIFPSSCFIKSYSTGNLNATTKNSLSMGLNPNRNFGISDGYACEKAKHSRIWKIGRSWCMAAISMTIRSRLIVYSSSRKQSLKNISSER